MSHIFISYARRDLIFANKIKQALNDRKLDTWIDLESIPKGEKWKTEIFRGIANSDAFLFFISPDSVNSEMCNEEIEKAVEYGKRIIPIYIRDTQQEQIAQVIKDINWIFCRHEQDKPEVIIDNFIDAISDIVKTIGIDYEWVRFHTKLEVKALDWASSSDSSRLLRGKELKEAEQQLASSGKRDPQPKDLQRQYILVSRRNEERQQRRRFTVSIFALVILAALSIFAWIQRDNALNAKAKVELQAKVALSRQLAAQAINLKSNQYDLALLLATQAYRINQTDEAQAGLLDVLEYNPRLQIFLKHNLSNTNMRVAFSFAGNLLATSTCTNSTGNCKQTEINIWNMDTGKLVNSPIFLDGRASLTRFSPDGKKLAFVVNDLSGDYVILLPLSKVEPLKKFDHNANDLVFTPDGKTLITVGFDNKIFFWDVQTSQQIGEPLIQSSVLSVAINSTGNLLATAGADGTILFWDIPSRKVIGTPIFPGANPIEYLSFSPNSRQLVVLSSANVTSHQAGALTLWDIDSRTLQYKQSLIGIYGAEFNPQGTILAFGNGNKIILLDLANMKSQTILDGQLADIIMDLAFSSDGNTLASTSTFGGLILWDLNSDHRLQHLIENKMGDWVQVIKSIKSTNFFASTWLKNSSIDLWDITSGKQIGKLESDLSGGIRSLDISSDGQFLAAGGDNQTIQLWNITQKKPWGLPLSGHTTSVLGLAFSTDGKYLVSSAFGDELIRLWDVQEHKLVTNFSTNDFTKNRIARIAFSPDSKSFATCGLASNIVVWDVETKRKQTIPFTKSSSSNCTVLVYSPDGSMIALNDISSGSGVVIKTSTANIIANLNLEHSSGLATGIAFSTDGLRLAISFCSDKELGCQKGTIALWDVSNFQSLGQFPIDYTQSTNALDFSSDNKVLVTGGKDGQIIALDVSVNSWLYRACQIANRNLSISEWEQYIGSASSYALTCPKLPAGEGVLENNVTNLDFMESDEPPSSLFQFSSLYSPEPTPQKELVIEQNIAATPPGGWQVEVGNLPDSLKFEFPAIVQCRASVDSDNYVQEFLGIWALKNTETNQWISKGEAHVTLLDTSGNEITRYPLGFSSGNNTTNWLMPDDNINSLPLVNKISPETILRLEIDSVEWEKTSDLAGKYKVDIRVENQSLYGNSKYPQHVVVFSVDNLSQYAMSDASVFAVVQNSEGETIDLLRSKDSMDLGSNEGGYFTANSASPSGRCVGKSNEEGNILYYWISFNTEDGNQVVEFYNTTDLR